MLIFAYLFPFFACILLKFGFDFSGKWSVYLWVFLIGEAFVASLHILFYYIRTHSTEYLGALVKEINYEAPWIELRPQTVTRRDGRGNTYTTIETRQVYHREKHYFISTLGSSINTNRSFFNYVLSKWRIESTLVSWTDRRIKGGVRYGENARMPHDAYHGNYDDDRWVCVTEKKDYVNKIRNSNSIFRFRQIDRKEAKDLGLYDYPEIQNHNAPCILSNNIKIDGRIREKFDRFNGRYAPDVQMRLYILVFNAEKGVGISEMQRAYWQGGNKNEFVVCLGVSDAGEATWARAFSWAENQQLEIETANWFMRNPKLNWDAFYQWFYSRYGIWKRKEFSDFKYINVNLPLWQVLIIYLGSLIENVIALIIASR